MPEQRPAGRPGVRAVSATYRYAYLRRAAENARDVRGRAAAAGLSFRFRPPITFHNFYTFLTPEERIAYGRGEPPPARGGKVA